MAVDPINGGNDSMYFYYPGRVWLDTGGKPIQAHGGGVLYDKKTKTYFWYGENKDGKTYKAHSKGADRVSNTILTPLTLFMLRDLWYVAVEALNSNVSTNFTFLCKLKVLATI